MPLAAGLFKQVSYKVEASYAVLPGPSAAQSLRRVSSSLDLNKDVYQSGEIRTDLQTADFRHGVRRVKGSINGELSAKTYADFIAAACKKAFTPGVSAAGLTLTSAGTGPTYTLTRGSGSYITDGFKVGDVVRTSLAGTNTAKNLLVTALTATIATVIVLNATTLAAEAPTGVTLSVQGKKTFVPTSGHTDLSFTIEHYYSDIVQSEAFTGCKVDKVAINLPPTGMATIMLDFMGQNVVPAAIQYFTAPVAATTTGVMAAVNGVCRVNGTTVAILTGLSINIDPGFTGDPVVGSNVVPNLFPGTVSVTGQATAYFLDTTLRDAFYNETEIDLYAVLTADNSAAADFVAFGLPRIKLGGAAKNDGQGGLVQTIPFTALYNKLGGTGTATEATTIQIQDSAA